MSPPPMRHRTALLSCLLLTIGLVGADLLAPASAAADAAEPTNFESVIDSVEPDTVDVDVDVVGGDSFLRVEAEPGVEVEIPGYDGEPYLRIDGDGTVLRNELSAATYLNQARDGEVDRLPGQVDSSAEPRWEQIGEGGVAAWHDHRIHWMLAQAPTVGEDRLVQRWTVPLVVDGEEVEVSGRLLLHSDDPPWALAVAVAAAVGAVVVSRQDRSRVPLLAGAAAVALGLSVASYLVNPPGAGASVLPLLLPTVALVLALASYAVPDSARYLFLPLASVAALAGWVIGRVGVLWMPLLPTTAPNWVDRAGTALVLGVAVGVAVAILLRPLPERAGGTPPSDAAVSG